LALVEGKVPLLIEFKPKGDYTRLCEEAMVILKGYTGKYAIQSFNPKIVNWFKKNYPDIIRGQLAEYFTDDETISKTTKFILKRMLLNPLTKPDFINYGLKDLPNKFARKAYSKALIVLGYTARNKLEFDMVKKYYHNAVFEFFRPDEKK
jgi:hypothetical protein